METDRRNFGRPLVSLIGTLPTISPQGMLQDSDSERCLRLEELLPGIHDDITLDKIAPKLSWKDFHVLSSVSRGWRHAIRSRQVYDARVRSETRETLALIAYCCTRSFCKIVLYSIREMSCCLLPPIPFEQSEGIRIDSQWFSLDGKVYVLGGYAVRGDDLHMHVLDLAGQRQWKQCASMRVRKSRIRCGVFNGKIFVFGKTHDCDRSYGGEVYDPKENTWSTIKATMFKGLDHDFYAIEAIGQELLLYGNTVRDNFPEVLVYHPGTDEWGELKHLGRDEACPFVAQGSLHSMSRNGIYIHDVDGNSWRQLHTCSFAANGRPNDLREEFLRPICIKAVEGELLVLSHCIPSVSNVAVFHSKGFSGDKWEIQLEKLPVDLFDGDQVLSDRCSLRLLQL